MSTLQAQPVKRDWRGFGLFCLIGSITFASQKFLDMRLHELWIPVGLSACVSFWFASLPKLRPLIGPTAAILFFGTLCMYTSSQGAEYENAPKIALVSGMAAVLSIVALAVIAPPKRMRRIAVSLLTLAAMASLICYFSGGHGATDGFVDWLMRTIGLTKIDAESLNLGIRKCIHITFYGLVGILSYRLARNSDYQERVFFMAILLTAIYGSFDEIRQSFDPSRMGQLIDVLLDTAAGATFIAGLRLRETNQARKVEA